MVSIAPMDCRRTGARGPWLWALACAAAALLALQPAAWGQQRTTLTFLTLKGGTQDASGTGDSLLADLEKLHGPLTNKSRQVNTEGVQLDIYAAPRETLGVAVSLEYSQYHKVYNFSDATGALPGEQLTLDGQALIYSLMGYLRLGPFLPFIGIGSGNYYVKYVQQQAGISFLDSASGVFSYRAGFRLLNGRLGLLVETGQTLATLHLDAEGTPATLELGGYFTNLGVSWLF